MTAEQIIIPGDCLEVLARLPENSIDAIVTDPPYGLSSEPDMREVLKHWLAGEHYAHPDRGGFMGRSWDSFVPGPDFWRAACRVLKPGACGFVFAGTRTQDLMSLSLTLGGFEVLDVFDWIYGSGFPKSMNVSKSIDKAAGATRPVVGTWKPQGTARLKGGQGGATSGLGSSADFEIRTSLPITADATDAAKHWHGWGTALKPAHEPAIFVRKPGGPLAAPTLTRAFFYAAKCSRKERDTGCESLTPRTGGEATLREEGSAGLDSPRAGAGRGGGVRNHHPTVKPVSIMRQLVALATPPGGIVLDMFAGSGSTGVASALEGASFVGIEREAGQVNTDGTTADNYVEIARLRIAAAERFR